MIEIINLNLPPTMYLSRMSPNSSLMKYFLNFNLSDSLLFLHHFRIFRPAIIVTIRDIGFKSVTIRGCTRFVELVLNPHSIVLLSVLDMQCLRYLCLHSTLDLFTWKCWFRFKGTHLRWYCRPSVILLKKFVDTALLRVCFWAKEVCRIPWSIIFNLIFQSFLLSQIWDYLGWVLMIYHRSRLISSKVKRTI